MTTGHWAVCTWVQLALTRNGVVEGQEEAPGACGCVPERAATWGQQSGAAAGSHVGCYRWRGEVSDRTGPPTAHRLRSAFAPPGCPCICPRAEWSAVDLTNLGEAAVDGW